MVKYFVMHPSDSFMKVLFQGLFLHKIIATNVGIKLHMEVVVNGITINEIIIPKYPGCRIKL
jgi:hypothetical protein